MLICSIAIVLIHTGLLLVESHKACLLNSYCLDSYRTNPAKLVCSIAIVLIHIGLLLVESHKAYLLNSYCLDSYKTTIGRILQSLFAQ